MKKGITDYNRINTLERKLKHILSQARKHQFLNCITTLQEVGLMLCEGLSACLKDGIPEGWGRGDVQAAHDMRPEGPPFWAGKDVVGYLHKKGWVVKEDGMHLSVGGFDFCIPGKMISESNDVPEVAAAKLAEKAYAAGREP